MALVTSERSTSRLCCRDAIRSAMAVAFTVRVVILRIMPCGFTVQEESSRLESREGWGQPGVLPVPVLVLELHSAVAVTNTVSRRSTILEIIKGAGRVIGLF